MKNAIKKINVKTTKNVVAKSTKNDDAKNAKTMMTIVQIANELNINPKIARAKLRRNNARANEKFYDVTIQKWRAIERDSQNHRDVVAILKSIKK